MNGPMVYCPVWLEMPVMVGLHKEKLELVEDQWLCCVKYDIIKCWF